LVADAQNVITELMQSIAAASRITSDNADHQSLERAEALEALQQIAASFADIVASLEVLCSKPAETPGLAAALRDAVASVRPPDVQVTVQPASQPEPKVSVTVQPAPVTVQPARDQPGQQWRMVAERPHNNPNAAPTAWLITRL
jgi:hypothetical protein